MILTVTIATFNVQDFIKESLESILNQTFNEFEVICIDDGSTDKTVQILKEYALKDSRIKVIAKDQNQGLAVARNESLALANGTYVVFFDGDDIYDLTLFEKAIKCIEKEQDDIVIWDYLSFWDKSEISKKQQEPSLLAAIEHNNKLALLQRPAFTWVKMIRTSKAKELGIHFPVGFTRQDIPVHWHLITQVDKIALLPEKLAFYRQQPDATTAKKDKKLFHLAFVMDVVQAYLHQAQLYAIYKNEFLRQQLNLLHGMYDNIKDEFKEEALVLIKERITDEHYNYLEESSDVRKTAKLFYRSLKGDVFSKLKLGVWKTTRYIYRTLIK
ncbi:glycosyltransferase family 2 protein [Flavobacterium tegetincola]|uniref:glycosyltransferase family 2 protein n=1 Tax=Flavobacterium tegetincola TaxID=150172 RepID=UPI0004039919|nr:glycosyltransferase family 2 protein [Flavobacterium tegetincola]